MGNYCRAFPLRTWVGADPVSRLTRDNSRLSPGQKDFAASSVLQELGPYVPANSSRGHCRQCAKRTRLLPGWLF